MAGNISSPPGRPRFDPVERLRHRFYEPLVLLCVLDPTRGPNPPYSSTANAPRDFPAGWRYFLDGLSFLCDFHRGGTTVCAIAGEARPSGTCFHLSTSAIRAHDHLKWVLEQLSQVQGSRRTDLNALSSRIEQKCVRFSVDKARNYARRLFNAIGGLQDILEYINRDPSNMALLAELQSIADLRSNHSALCDACYGFTQRDRLEALERARAGLGEQSPWSQIRHYLGRLASWKRISRSIVQFVEHYPQVLDGFTTEVLLLPAPQAGPAADHKTNVNSALGRMLGEHERADLERLTDALSSIPDMDIPLSFVARYENPVFMPHVHAELQLVEHFYRNSLDFVAAERYIGCSKPSCHCCSLYIRFHPGNFTLRPSHGNLWQNWAPPLQWSDYGKGGSHRGIMNAIISHLRSEVRSQIESRMARRMRIPDSSNGEWAVG